MVRCTIALPPHYHLTTTSQHLLALHWVGHLEHVGHVGGVEALTQDHKPNKPSERKAIEARGGKVVRGFGCARVDGVLAVSRALGDVSLKPHGTPRSDVGIVCACRCLPVECHSFVSYYFTHSFSRTRSHLQR